MTLAPTFSIVTPSLNQSAFLTESLVSVQQQVGWNVEHLVMDGRSSDSSLEILRGCTAASGWEHLRWSSESDRGQSDAINKGFRLARGEFIGWLNSDDRYRAGAFDCVARVFAEHPEVDIVYGDSTWIDESGRVFRVRREIEFSRFILHYHRVLYIPTTATFFRRRVIEEGNLLNENLQYAMDYEFFVRLAHRGYRFKHVPALLGDFRWHAASKTCRAAEGQLRETADVACQYSRVLTNLRSPVSRSLAFTALRYAAGFLRYSEKAMRGYYLNQYRSVNLCK